MRTAGRPAAEAAAGLAAAWWLGHGGGLWPALLPGALLAPVGLVAAQHGLAAGVGTGVCAAALALADAGVPPGALLGFEGDRLPVALAYGYVALGAAIGLVGEGHGRRLGAAAAVREGLEARLAYAEGALAGLIAAKAALERRFAREVAPVEALERAAAVLARLPAAQAGPAALELAERYLGARAAGLYVGGALEAGRGDVPAAGGALVGRAAATGGLVAARSPAVRAEAGAWLAAPVPGGAAVLALVDLPFERLTPVTEAGLTALARALGDAWAGRQARVWLGAPIGVRGAGRPLPEAS